MSHKGEAYSSSGAIFLDNPIRRLFQPPSEIIEKLFITPSEVVVDFGCGPGFFTVDLAKKAKSVVAVDISPEMLKRAERKAKNAGVKNIEFLLSDGKTLQLEDNSVDKILLVTVYHEVGDSEVVLKEFGRVLKSTGKLAIVEVIKKGFLPSAPVQNPDKLKAEIESENFKLEEMLSYKSYGIFLFSKA
jgi:ubiquinone/menaquinone biosynthesis C-methylase UbiE